MVKSFKNILQNSKFHDLKVVQVITLFYIELRISRLNGVVV